MPEVAPAAAVVDSATTTPEFNPSDQYTWSSEQRDQWNRTGELPKTPEKQDSAPAKKDTKKETKPAAESGPQPADAPDSAPDKKEPHLKTKEDTERRFNEILTENKTLKARLDALERAKPSESRETKQDSQPAAEVYKPLDEKEYFRTNPKATYEDFVRASGKHEGIWAARQEIAAENQRRAQAEAQKELNSRVEEAKKRYPDFEARIQPAVKAIADDQQIPHAVKAVLNDSPAFVDLMYVLAEPASLADLVQTAKTNPAAAIRKIVLTEQLVMAELGKATLKASEASKDGKERDESGKFVASKGDKKDAEPEPKPRAPKIPPEVGGKGAALEDAAKTAARSGNFAAFEAEQIRRARAGMS